MSLWGVRVVMGSPLEPLGASFWDRLGVIFGALGGHFGSFLVHFGSLWGSFGGSLGRLRSSFRRLGSRTPPTSIPAVPF